MSTIVRSRADRASAGSAREPLTARAVRVRNACLRDAAARLGMPVPEDAELNALSAHASLADTIERWRGVHGAGGTAVGVRARPRFLQRTAWAAVITLLGLAFSYGPVG
ncbi:MAG TPA: hypothetical protein VHG09_14785 [Longimicrobiales bacterium]|nr:hypothetical protein [Longimicrobiales bacterium]